MLVPDRKCGPRCQYFRLLPVGVAGGVYELPCTVGDVSGPFENTNNLLPAHFPSIFLVPYSTE